MKFTINCPDCGKVLEVIVNEVASSKVVLAKKVEKELDLCAIIQSIEDGEAEKYLSEGDEILINLKDGTNLALQVASISLYEEGQVIFTCKDLVGEDICMNEENTNKGGWESCKARKVLNEEIIKLLPDELVNAISPRKITQILDKGKKSVTEDRLWMLSATEVFGDNYGKSDSPDEKQFSIFKDRRNRIKLDKEGSASGWWLRSPSLYYLTAFCVVYAGGSYSGCYATLAIGVCFGFCINKKNKKG